MINNLFKKNNIFVLICLLVIFFQFFQTLYIKRSYFLEGYNASYWKDRVEHSQWLLPLSHRAIGDDGLYSFVGLSLIKGSSPAALNAEIPPLGKYLIGLSIILFKSPAYYALFLSLGSLVLFYLISKKIFKEDFLPIFLTASLSLDPLFLGQLWTSWLDIAQLFFLLLNMYFLFISKEAKKRSILLIILAGISLGFFAETKPPLLFPFIAAIEIVYLLINKKRLGAIMFIFSIGIAVLLAYTKYFIDGNSIISFIKLQKYIISFYLKSQLSTHVGAIWSILFIGKFPNITTGTFQTVGEWWIVWPITTVFGLIGSFKSILSKRDHLVISISLILIIGLFVYSFIPSYSRYLLLLLPFLYLLTGVFLEKYLTKLKPKAILILLLYVGIANSMFYLLPNPMDTINNFTYSFSNQFFKDIYVEDLSTAGKILSPDEFDLNAKELFAEGEIKSVDFKTIGPNPSRFSGTGKVKLLLTYKTQDLGSFTEMKNLSLKKENGRWKIIWDPTVLINGFAKGYSLKTTKILGKRGSIRLQGNVLVQDAPGLLISVNPQLASRTREDSLLKLIGEITDIQPVAFQNAYNENIIPNTFIPLATTFSPLNQSTKEELLKYSGVRISDYPSRIYTGIPNLSIKNTFYNECCTRIYSSFDYHGVDGVEEKYDAVLSGGDGGSLFLVDDKGKIIRTIINKKPKNGKDISI